MNGKPRQGVHIPTYNSWYGMKSRCLNPNDSCYERYGGRGVLICPEWMEYPNFLADMGERPEGLTLDRIDNEGDYEPSNCRWATRKEQVLNRAYTRWIDYNGETLCVKDFTKKYLTCTSRNVYDLLDAGWSMAKILKTHERR